MSRVLSYLRSCAASYIDNELEYAYNAWIYGVRPVLSWQVLPLINISDEAAYGIVSFDMEHPTITQGLALWSPFLFNTYKNLYKVMAQDVDKRNILLYPHHLFLTNEKDKKLHDKYTKKISQDMPIIWQSSYVPPFIYSYIAETPIEHTDYIPSGFLKKPLDNRLPIVATDYLTSESTNPFSAYLTSIPTFDAFYMAWTFKLFPELVVKQCDLTVLPELRRQVIAVLLYTLFPDSELGALMEKYDLKEFSSFPEFIRPYLEFIKALKAQEAKYAQEKGGSDEFIIYD